jgi:PhnB protein
VIRPNLFFTGDAGNALNHYRTALGGELEIARYADAPGLNNVEAEWAPKVMYATLHTPYGDVNAMDAPPERAGTPGDNFAVAVDIDDEDRAALAFATLATEGTIIMPFEQTFFARKFGMASDKYGVKWMISVPSRVPVAS